MKKWLKIFYAFYCIYFLCYAYEFYFSDDYLNFVLYLIIIFIPIIIYRLIKFIKKIILSTINKIIDKENDKIKQQSTKVKKIMELNNSYKFKELKNINRNIIEREYSRKSLDRVTGESVIRYHLENNIDFLRTDIENAIYNINMLKDYQDNVEVIINQNYKDESDYSLKKFNKIEKRVLNNLIFKKEDYLVNVSLKVFYRSNSGRVYDSKERNYTFDELASLYNDWLNGNRFEETKKQERKIINDDIRYNVLKRDNFTCKICGATAKDGAKLHVDHIIPVSEGGKTVMSNLQTLCDRCNLGKSNKTDKDFAENMICPNCGGKLVKRKSAYGEFIGCSNYPKCHYKK